MYKGIPARAANAVFQGFLLCKIRYLSIRYKLCLECRGDISILNMTSKRNGNVS